MSHLIVQFAKFNGHALLAMLHASSPVKVSLWDCCVVTNDARPPLGVFIVMTDPHLYPVHMFTSVICALRTKLAEYFSTGHNLTIRNYYLPRMR